MFNKTGAVFLTFFIIILILGKAVLFGQQKIEYEDFVKLLNEGKVKQVSITDELIKGVYLEEGNRILFSTTYPPDISLYELLNIMRKKGVAIVPLKSSYILSEGGFIRNLAFLLPSLLLFAILVVILILNILIYKNLKRR